jgi:hypothetical protein
MTQRTCIFCGKYPLTREDVWPKWLIPYLPRVMPRHSNASHLIHPDGAVITSRNLRPGDPMSTRAKCVCAPCNNGWMSALQTRAKSLVLPLVRGQEIGLSPIDQRVLAAWIAMSAVTSEFFSPATVAIPQADRDRVRHYAEAPTHWKIWIGNYRRQNWRPYRIHNALEITEKDVTESASIHNFRIARPNTQTTTIVFGQLYAHVASSTFPEVVARLIFPRPVDAILTQLWPPRADDIAWPPGRVMTDQDADDVAAYLYVVRLIGGRPE